MFERVWPFANYTPCFDNKGLQPLVVLSALIMFSGFTFAHEGFNRVLEDASVNPYTVRILGDTHLAGEQLQSRLMFQVSRGREAAPADTTIKLRLENSSGIVYENEVPYVGSSSSDGRSFYAYYFATVPLKNLESYEMRLELNGSLGQVSTSLNFQPKLAPAFRATELIPSLMILGLCLVAVVMFVVSSRQPSLEKKGLHHV
jgi:hypothetical protein